MFTNVWGLYQIIGQMTVRIEILTVRSIFSYLRPPKIDITMHFVNSSYSEGWKIVSQNVIGIVSNFEYFLTSRPMSPDIFRARFSTMPSVVCFVQIRLRLSVVIRIPSRMFLKENRGFSKCGRRRHREVSDFDSGAPSACAAPIWRMAKLPWRGRSLTWPTTEWSHWWGCGRRVYSFSWEGNRMDFVSESPKNMGDGVWFWWNRAGRDTGSMSRLWDRGTKSGLTSKFGNSHRTINSETV
jgi:hypothetical protein